VATLALAACQAQNTGSWQALNAPSNAVVYALAPDPHLAHLLYAGASTGHVYRILVESVGAQVLTGLPGDANVAALAADPAHAGVLYAGTSRGVYASADYGETWRTRSSGLPGDDGADALALAVGTAAGTPLFAGTEGHGVYVSQDAGATWQARGAGLPAGVAVFGLLYDAPTATLYAALAARGVYASTDSGQMWVARSSGLPASAATLALLALPATGAAAGGQTLFAGTDKGAFASTDAGQTWHDAGLGQARVAALALDPTSPTTLYAGVDSNVYRSVNGGKSWAVVAPGMQQAVYAIGVLPDQHGREIVFAGGNQLLRYPAIPGGSSLVSTVLSILIVLALVGTYFYFTRRTTQRLRSMRTSRVPPSGGARGGAETAQAPGSQGSDASTTQRDRLN
jgi:ligand-binding sensor domain-containing protein